MATSGMTRHKQGKKPNKSQRRISVTQRWITNNLGVVILIVLVIELAFVYAIQTFYYSSARQSLTSELTSVVNILSRYAQDSDTNLSSEMRNTLESFSAKEKMELMAVNAKGRVVLTSSGFSPTNLAMPDYDNVMNGGDGYWVGTADNGEKIMALSANISGFSNEYSAVRVVVSLTTVDDAVQNITLAATGICIAIVLMLILTGIYFMNSLIHPIKQMSSIAGKFAKGDFSFRIRYDSNDEVGDLVTAINHMADELSNAEAMKNEFISSVSHELRTPLTAIKG